MGTAINKTTSINLQNKSGVHVDRGDVVLFSPTTSNAFIATGSSGLATDIIGVVLEPGGIDNNVNGMIAIGGYVPIINLVSGASIGDTFNLSSVTRKAMPHTSILPGDFGQVLESGLTPQAILWNTEPSQRGNFVAARYGLFSGTATNGIAFYPNLWVKDYDTHNAFTTGTSTSNIATANRFTAPVSGYYNIGFRVRFVATAWVINSTAECYVYINGIAGSDYWEFDKKYFPVATAPADFSIGGNTTVFMTQGTFITFSIYQTSGSSKDIQNSGRNNAGDSYFQITKVG